MPKSEKEKMIAGEFYTMQDDELRAAHRRALRLTRLFNNSMEDDPATRQKLIRELFAQTGERFHIEPPFRCDYGFNISIGEDFYANFDCIMLDVCPIRIGKSVWLGPRVSLFAAGHPLDPELRASGQEFGKPITIEDGVWIGGNVTILPGVTIGKNTVVGAGSVVTKDLPAGVLAMGNPCQVKRTIVS
ncbi:MAG: sugar O-acetyltransferase [Planctomycetia bacterium]|nr:sugar O-acetyltransferase [Planctomycetia bacterium]